LNDFNKKKEVFIMTIRHLLEMVNKDKRKKERVKAALEITIGMGIATALGVAIGVLIAPKSGKETREDLKIKVEHTVEAIKDKVHEKSELVKDTASFAAQELGKVIKDVRGKTEDVRKDIKEGGHEIA
jgi:gas vesicle protein